MSFIKKYKAFLIGFIITWLLSWILEYKGVILIDRHEYLTNILGFLFYWLLISVFIHKIHYLKTHINSVKKIIGLLIVLIVILIFDSNAKMPDNPITILLFTVFYLSIAYVIAPTFFRRYRIVIIGFYALAYSIFLYLRLFSESFEIYKENGKEILLLFFFPIPIFATLWAYQQWKWLQTIKAEKAKAELSMLQAQMNPHFFFNTLNNLYALAIKKSDRAPEVLLKLSEMMRYTIYEGKKGNVLVKDEIEYLLNYIELHKIRYKKKVDISFKHDTKEETTIAPLLFIILLENAFKHGVELLSENAFIDINLYEKGNYLHFKINNNFEDKIKIDSSGIGLDNLRRRLSLLFDKDYELNITEENNIYTTELKIPVNA